MTALPILGGPNVVMAASLNRTEHRIVYVRYVGEGDQELYTVRPDGSGQRRLTSNESGDLDPSYSPSGRSIAYQCHAAHGDQAAQTHGEICVMAASGRDVRRLTHNRVGDWSPAWSPNGKWLLFVRVFKDAPKTFHSDLFKMRSDGSHVIRLTDDPSFESAPAWAPGARRITYASDGSGNGDIFVARADGSKPRNVTASAQSESDPAWSHDGRALAFARFVESDTRSEGWQIFKVLLEGRRLRRLTEDEGGLDLTPAWSPNDRRIVFARDDDLFIVHSDGGRTKRVTGRPATSQMNDVEPDWR